ncbi:MAG: hypothetical protein MZV63_52285 [Marinilabiliales bacterium]|nr:hypothetical protein [Marinilabiliales bacterium]
MMILAALAASCGERGSDSKKTAGTAAVKPRSHSTPCRTRIFLLALISLPVLC